MPAVTTKIQSVLILNYKSGVDGDGNDIVKAQRMPKVKVASTDDNLLAVGNAVGGLLKYPLVNVARQDDSTIING